MARPADPRPVRPAPGAACGPDCRGHCPTCQARAFAAQMQEPREAVTGPKPAGAGRPEERQP